MSYVFMRCCACGNMRGPSQPRCGLFLILLPSARAQVARTAKMMVTQMGFSKKLGQVAWSGGGGPSFLGQSMGQPADCSGQTSDEIDSEVKQLVDRAYR